MTALSKFATAVVATVGTWTNTGNVFASDSTYATNTLTAGEQASIKTGTYNFDASMPSAMTVTSVQLEFAAYVSAGSAWVLYENSRDASKIMTGSRVVYTIDITSLVTLSRSYFLNATFKPTVTILAGSGGATLQLDYVKIIVNYDPAGTGSGTIETFSTIAYQAPEQLHVPRYQVEVRKLGQPTKHELVTIMDEFEAMTITRKWQQPDEFSITFHRENKATAPLLQMYPIYDTDGVTLLGYKQQAVVRVLRDGREEISSLIEKRAFRMAGSEPGTGHWTVFGWDLASGLLRRRTALPTGGSDSDDQTAVTPGAAISHYVTNNYITPVTGGSGRGNNATGAVSDLRMGYATTRGFAVTWKGSNQQLTDMLTQICQAGNVGYRSYCDLAMGQAVLDIYAGVDRTFPDTTGGGILLSFGLQNVLSLEYDDDGFQVVNYASVGGSGIGANRTTQTVSDTYSISKYGQAEAYYDWRLGGTDTATLTSAGQARVRAKASGERVAVTLIDDGALGYRTKWDLGDTVTVSIPDINVLTDLQIVQVATTLNPGARPTISITFGTQPTTPAKIIAQIQQDLFNATQNPPQEYGVTLSKEAAAHGFASDADFASGSARTGAIEISKDTTSGNVRLGVKTAAGWVTGPPMLNNEIQPVKTVSGAGRTNGSDSDFGTAPPDGAVTVVKDTNTGYVYNTMRIAGAWTAGPPMVNNEIQPAKVVSGAGKVNASDADFASTPPDGATAVVKNTTTGDVRNAMRIGGTWTATAPLYNESSQDKVIAGAGKVAAIDADFTGTPPDGTTAIVRNTSTGELRVSVRANGAWKTSMPLYNESAITTVFSGVSKLTVADSDFTVTPPDGTHAFSWDTAGLVGHHFVRIAGTWKSVNTF